MLKMRLDEVLEQIDESEEFWQSFRRDILVSRGEKCVLEFDKWLQDKISLEIERHDLLKT